jgi:DNA-binding MarR family transcriptional regulator
MSNTVHKLHADAAPALDTQVMELLELLTYTQQKINEHLEKALAADNLSLAHYRALFFVLRYPGITVSGLIDKLNITKQSLARVLSDLMKGKDAETTEGDAQSDGYLYAMVDQSDRRARRLFLTTRGDTLMHDALLPITEALKRSFAQLKFDTEKGKVEEQ